MFTQIKFLYHFFAVVLFPVKISRILRLGDFVMQAAPNDLFDEQLKRDPYLRHITRNQYMGEFPTVEEKDQYAEGTLGHAYIEFLESHGITPYAELIPVQGRIYASKNDYLKERVRYLRDLMRMLLSLDTTYEDEAALNAFLFSQFPSPLPAAVVGGIILKAVFSEPVSLSQIFRKVVLAYRCGESSRNFLSIKWETMWHMSVDEARAELEPSAHLNNNSISRLSMI